MELGEIRKKLDAIDGEIIKLIAERQSNMKAVAQYKKAHNLPVNQPEREKEALKVRSELAIQHGLDNEVIVTIFQTIFEYSKQLQEQFSKSN